jgi:hypothetical protein
MKKLFTERAGHRGAFLAFLSLLDFLYGYSILTDSGPLQVYHLILPIIVWGWIWVAMGAVLLSGVFIRRDKFHFGLSATFKCAWVAAWVNVWITQAFPRVWVSIVIWAAFAALVVVVSSWPETRRHRSRDSGPLPKLKDGDKSK